jgi:hypothetical protein
MSEQGLMAIIQLMGSLLNTEGLEAENKKKAEIILSKALGILEHNIVGYHAQLVSKIKI